MNRKPSLLVIFLTVFLDLIGFGIVLPLLPRYCERFGLPTSEIGWVVGAFSLMQLVFAHPWGRLSDRIGRRPVLLLGNLGSAVSYALFALAAYYQGRTGLWLLVLSRVFAGACGATLGVASAYIADITPPAERSRRMGLIGMAFGLGFVIGPALGGWSGGQFGLAAPGWIAAGLCAFNFLLGLVILGESRRPGPVVPQPSRWAQVRATLTHPTLGRLIGVYFLATFCFTCFEVTLPLLLHRNFNYDEKHAGYLFTFCGLVGAFTQGGLLRVLLKRMGDARLLAISLAFVAVSLALMPFAHTLGALLGVLALFSAASNLNRPPTMGLISVHSPPDQQGATLSVAQNAATVSRIVGPIVATWLFAWRVPVPYLVCGALALLTCGLAWRFFCVGAIRSPAIASATGPAV